MRSRTLRFPWGSLSVAAAEGIEREATFEIAPGHELAGLGLVAFARCSMCDSAALELSDGTYALIHLAWTQSAEVAPRPTTVRCRDYAAVRVAMDAHVH